MIKNPEPNRATSAINEESEFGIMMEIIGYPTVSGRNLSPKLGIKTSARVIKGNKILFYKIHPH